MNGAVSAACRRALLSLALLAGACLSSLCVAEESSDPAVLLKRMIAAAQDLNYDGTFVFRSGSVVETMRIIHRRDDQGERERLLSLGGVAREVLRDNDLVTCILPDNASVVVGKRRLRGVNRGPLFSGGEVPAHYALSVQGLDRVAGRVTERLAVKPKDEFRYGYRLWLDRETGLLLRSALVSPQGETLEDIAYTSLTMPDAISEELLRPTISGIGFRWVKGANRDGSSSRENSSEWSVGWVPDGFAITDHAVESTSPEAQPVEHLVFSDGLASMSVFIEELASASEPLEGHSRMGAVSAFGRMVGLYQITVVGEVPSNTVQQVGDSVTRR